MTATDNELDRQNMNPGMGAENLSLHHHYQCFQSPIQQVLEHEN
jgi:hypothetical protein